MTTTSGARPSGDGPAGVELGIEELRTTLTDAFTAASASNEEAERIADALVEAELREVPTHGVLRVPWYLSGMRSGTYRTGVEPTVRSVAPAVTLLDGHGALGYLPTWRALDEAIANAERTGIGMAGVANVGEFGRAAYYASEAARRGYVAVVGQNTLPLLGAPGATAASHGNNPLAFSGPGDDAPIFDAAFTPRSGGELRRRSVLGLPLPVEWGYTDADGNVTTDPDEAVLGVQPAVGGAKGFGLAVLVDLFAGILTGAASGPSVTPGQPCVGAFVLALDPAVFGATDAVPREFATAAAFVRDNGGRWPGDRARAARDEHAARGTVAIPGPIWAAARRAIDDTAG